MKLFIILLIVALNSYNLISQQVEKLIDVPWNTEGGIQTKWATEGNYGNFGIQDFEVLNNEEVAIYASLENKMKIYNFQNEELTYEFSITDDVSSFTYDNLSELFYIVTHSNRIQVYCKMGAFMKSIPLHPQIGTPSIIKFDDGNIYVSMHYTSYPIVKNGVVLSPAEQINESVKGRIIGDGFFYIDSLVSDNSIKFLYVKQGEEFIASIIYFNDVFVSITPLFLINNELGFDICLKKLENNKLKYYHKIINYSLSSNYNIFELDVPKIKYLTMFRNFKEFDGNVYNLITTPDGAKLFRINDMGLKCTGSYPEELNYEYDYHDELDRITKKKDDLSIAHKSTPISPQDGYITRSQIIDKAIKYKNVVWNATNFNFPDNEPANAGFEYLLEPVNPLIGDNCSCYGIWVPSWISTIEDNIGMPYKWGGFTDINDWHELVADYRITGDQTSGCYDLSDDQVIGVDCSGFISKVWNQSSHYGTRELPNLSTDISGSGTNIFGNLRMGDILNNSGHHVMLFLQMDGNNYVVIHSEGVTHGRVLQESMTEEDLDGFIPRRYNNILDYDLVATSCQIIKEDEEIQMTVKIKNKGTSTFDQRIRASCYNRPDNVVDDLISAQFTTNEMNVYIAPGEEETHYLSTTNYPSTPDVYMVTFEFQNSDGYWNYIPESDYRIKFVCPINCLLIRGVVYDRLANPLPGVVVRAVQRQGLKNDLIKTEYRNNMTDINGEYLLVVPSSWEQIILSVDESNYSEQLIVNAGDFLATTINFYYTEFPTTIGPTPQANRRYQYHDGIKVNGNSTASDIVDVCGEIVINPAVEYILEGDVENYNLLTLDLELETIPWISWVSIFTVVGFRYIVTYEVVVDYKYEYFASVWEVDGNNPSIRLSDEIMGWIEPVRLEDELIFSPLIDGSWYSSNCLYFDAEDVECFDSYVGGVKYIEFRTDVEERLGVTFEPGKYYGIKLANNINGWDEVVRYIYILPEDHTITGNFDDSYRVYNTLTIRDAYIYGNDHTLIAGDQINIEDYTLISGNNILLGIDNIICGNKSSVPLKDKKGRINNQSQVESESVLSNILNLCDESECVFLNYNIGNQKSQSIDNEINYSEEIKIFPNPTDGIIWVENPRYYESSYTIEILDIKDNILLNYEEADVRILRVDLSSYPKGTYIVQIKDVNTIHIQKVVYK